MTTENQLLPVPQRGDQKYLEWHIPLVLLMRDPDLMGKVYDLLVEKVGKPFEVCWWDDWLEAERVLRFTW